MRNNRNYAKKNCYNINMIDLTENQKIKEFKTKITKTIINLTKSHIKYHLEEFCDCGEFDKTIILLTNIKAFCKKQIVTK